MCLWNIVWDNKFISIERSYFFKNLQINEHSIKNMFLLIYSEPSSNLKSSFEEFIQFLDNFLTSEDSRAFL